MFPAPRQALFAAAIVLAAAGSGLAGFLLWQWLATPPSVNGVVQDGCDLNRAPCLALFPDGVALTLSMAPRPIPLAAPIMIRVQLTDIAVESVEVDMSSPDLDTGRNHHKLVLQADGRYGAQAVLPLCALDRVNWDIQVTARTRQGIHATRFRFETAAAAHGRG